VKAFEYRMTRCTRSEPDAVLNEWGGQGWDLVYVSEPDEGFSVWTFIFKREIPDVS
jgi:hypothetical protein